MLHEAVVRFLAKLGAKVLAGALGSPVPKVIDGYERRWRARKETKEERRRREQQQREEEEEAAANAMNPLDPSQLVDMVMKAIKSNLRGLVLSNVLIYLRFFSTRVAVGSTLFHAAKEGVRRLAARHASPRTQHMIYFVLDVSLPSSAFGPILGITIGILELTGRIPRLMPPWSTSKPWSKQSEEEKADEQEAVSEGADRTAATALLITTLLEHMGAHNGHAGTAGLPGLATGTPAAVIGSVLGLPAAPAAVAA